MKFQSFRLVPGEWVDPKEGRLVGSIGLRPDVVVMAWTAEDAIRKLRSPFNPSPIVAEVKESMA